MTFIKKIVWRNTIPDFLFYAIGFIGFLIILVFRYKWDDYNFNELEDIGKQ